MLNLNFSKYLNHLLFLFSLYLQGSVFLLLLGISKDRAMNSYINFVFCFTRNFLFLFSKISLQYTYYTLRLNTNIYTYKYAYIFYFVFFSRTYIDNMYKKVEDFFTSLKNSQKKKLCYDNTRVLRYLWLRTYKLPS